MKSNRIKVVINRHIQDVFRFTTDPSHTHLWISSITKEISSKYPPRKGTKYRNRGEDLKWNVYEVKEFRENELFTLSDAEENYSVRYTYKKLANNKTELEYFERVKEGELKNPFTVKNLHKLRSLMESKVNQTRQCT